MTAVTLLDVDAAAAMRWQRYYQSEKLFSTATFSRCFVVNWRCRNPATARVRFQIRGGHLLLPAFAMRLLHPDIVESSLGVAGAHCAMSLVNDSDDLIQVRVFYMRLCL